MQLTLRTYVMLIFLYVDPWLILTLSAHGIMYLIRFNVESQRNLN